MKMMIFVLHQKTFFMRIIKKPFLINIPLFSIGWFYKLALLDFELIFEVKMQESEGV